MALQPDDREHVISSVVDILKHHHRDRLLRILEDRLEAGDYDELAERDIDRVVLALARAVESDLEPGSPE